MDANTIIPCTWRTEKADCWRMQKRGKFAYVNEDSFSATSSRDDGVVGTWRICMEIGFLGVQPKKTKYMDLPCGWTTLL